MKKRYLFLLAVVFISLTLMGASCKKEQGPKTLSKEQARSVLNEFTNKAGWQNPTYQENNYNLEETFNFEVDESLKEGYWYKIKFVDLSKMSEFPEENQQKFFNSFGADSMENVLEGYCALEQFNRTEVISETEVMTLSTRFAEYQGVRFCIVDLKVNGYDYGSIAASFYDGNYEISIGSTGPDIMHAEEMAKIFVPIFLKAIK